MRIRLEIPKFLSFGKVLCTEAYQGLQLVRCFALRRLIFIRIDKMFLHFSIKFTDTDAKLLGIATEFSRYARSFCLFDKNLVECFMYNVLIITSSWNVFGQNEKKQVDMT
jgi:hypothetical protein